MKTTIVYAIRLIGLTVVYFTCFLVVAAIVFPAPPQSSSEQANPALALLLVSFLNAAVLEYLIWRSRWSGWKLVLVVFVTLFGVVTVMSQIETAVFVTRLPPGMLPRIFLGGALVSAAFSTLAVLILGKLRSRQSGGPALRLPASIGEWAWKAALIIVMYVVLYFTFGYFIAWQSPAVRAYYGGSDPQGFFVQMGNTLRNMPWLVPLQAVRAILWAALGVLIIRMLKRSWLEAGLLVALMFSVVMNSQLLIPNPYMPPEVRMAHLLETASSNFLFGCLLVWVLSIGKKQSAISNQ